MGRLAEWRRVARAYPTAADALLAALVFAVSLLPVNPPGGPPRDPLTAGAVLLAFVGCAALAVRRRYPLPVLGVTLAAAVLALLTHQARGPFVITVAIAAYTVATRTHRRTAFLAGAVSALLLGAAAALTLDVPWLDPAVVVLLLWLGVAVAVGDAVRSRRAYVAVLEEWARWAEQIREEETEAPTEPAPSLNRLDALVEGFSTGQPVRWTVAGQPRPLPSAVDVAAYRIIEESLTNAHKHAPGAAVAVRLRYDPEGVTIEVRDEGGPAAAPGSDAAALPTGARAAGPQQADDGLRAGLGLVGMRERAETVGGAFSAGPRPGGGWLVRAELPAPEEEAE
ncbi:sensor histidine kinase [Micromonospora sp. IBHARD004]|uniref:sensor histidine kinase n=1 Tax=Micromonospora sp. IBHARD004 TaxID=3457764 RepID=UPI004059A470